MQRVTWNHQSDEIRARTLKNYHTSYLKPFSEDARVWLSNNWERWELEDPAWFTEKWKHSLPNLVLPPEVEKALQGTHRPRRSTLSEQLGLSTDDVAQGQSRVTPAPLPTTEIRRRN